MVKVMNKCMNESIINVHLYTFSPFFNDNYPKSKTVGLQKYL